MVLLVFVRCSEFDVVLFSFFHVFGMFVSVLFDRIDIRSESDVFDPENSSSSFWFGFVVGGLAFDCIVVVVGSVVNLLSENCKTKIIG